MHERRTSKWKAEVKRNTWLLLLQAVDVSTVNSGNLLSKSEKAVDAKCSNLKPPEFLKSNSFFKRIPSCKERRKCLLRLEWNTVVKWKGASKEELFLLCAHAKAQCQEEVV